MLPYGIVLDRMKHLSTTSNLLFGNLQQVLIKQLGTSSWFSLGTD